MPAVTVLHIENDANDILLFQHACSKAGMTLNLQVAKDGEEALAYLKNVQTDTNNKNTPLPTLVILDLDLPHLNGFDVLTWMRNEKHFRRLPVIVLTSSKLPEDVKRAYDLGANSYLVKPVALEDLVSLAKGIDEYWLSLNQRPTQAP